MYNKTIPSTFLTAVLFLRFSWLQKCVLFTNLYDSIQEFNVYTYLNDLVSLLFTLIEKYVII